MDFKDYYATLGIDKTASDADIKRAYRKLARKHHPDLNPGDKTAEARFKEINEANEVLGDPEKRRKYDELGANWRAYEQSGGQPGGQGGWSGGFGGGGTYRTMTPDEVEEMFGGQGDDPFSDFFHTFFGGARSAGGSSRQARSGRAARGRDIEHPIELTLEEAFAGTTRRIVSKRGGKDRSIEVRIPAGIKDGARVRAAGEGAPGQTGAPSGDLYLAVRVLPHARFERRGNDLSTNVPVPLVTAVLGGEVAVATLGGSTVRLKIPPLTQQGQVLRLRGHGMPVAGRPNERGDLYATIDVRMPNRVTEEERRHYEALKTLYEGRQEEKVKP